MAATGPDDPPVLPGYAFIRLIGRGTYGDIWMAREVSSGFLRAVKLVRRAAFDDDGPFRREMDGIRRYQPVSQAHPGLLPVYALGTDSSGGTMFCVMELADCRWHGTEIDPGHYKPHSLSHEFRSRQRLGVVDTLALGISLAGALDTLHRAGLVHRDLKPANIVFAGKVPRLADMGTVTVAGESSELLGSPGYMPPEGPGTPRGDVFSLGKILYEAVTGLPAASFPQLPGERLLGAEGRALRELNAVLLKACDPDPQRAYTSAAELLADLQALAEGRPPGAARSAPRRLPAVAGIVLAAAAAVLGLRSCGSR